jgi:hypothetical protein
MIPPLIYLERFRNEGTRIYSRHADYSEALEEYRPDSNRPTFDLPAFLLPAEGLDIYTANPSPDLLKRYLPGDRALFCIHPQLLGAGREDPYLRRTLATGVRAAPIPVSPSSSTRTLYVQEGAALHALKVHFPFRVSRYGRRMRAEVVEQAINVSRVLEEGSPRLDDRFAYLREVLGMTHRNLQPDLPRAENWGYLVRDMQPFPASGEVRALVPGFALYGGDFYDREKPPLILELIGSGEPEDYLLRNIMIPIIRHWVTCFREFGFILEPHGQNVLFEADEEGHIHRIVHRDLNVGIDMRRRRDQGLPDRELNDYNRMESGEFNSIAYDKFMGGHFFNLLLSSLQEWYPKLNPAEIREACRDEFARLFPEHERYLPRTIQYFTEKRDQFGKPLWQDTGEAPAWRP